MNMGRSSDVMRVASRFICAGCRQPRPLSSAFSQHGHSFWIRIQSRGLQSLARSQRQRRRPAVEDSATPVPAPFSASLLRLQPQRPSYYSTRGRPSARPGSEYKIGTDITRLDVFEGGPPMPATAVTACLADGFRLEGGGVVSDGAGVLVVGGEAFEWRPGPLLQRLRQPPQQGSTASGEGSGLLDGSGRFDLDAESLGVLDVLWPRPDILIIGTGSRIRPLSQRTANMITDLGIRVEVLDTRNAAAQYNMLVQERGLQEVAAALIPVGLM